MTGGLISGAIWPLVKIIHFAITVLYAKNVNISCIAEFVHNKSVQSFIEELEITYSQGYYFSQPNEEIVITK